MPVQTFIDEFLPPLPAGREKDILSSRGAFKGVPSSAATPAEIYEPLITALNKCTKRKSRVPGLFFENASERSEHPHERGYMKPHICCYASPHVDLVRRSPISSQTEFGYAELFFEVKPDVSLDFFTDPSQTATAEARASHEFVTQHEDRETKARVDRSLALHIEYATEILARQNRVFLFSVSMAGSLARLCRWDRSGLIVSGAFDIHDRPDLLCEFLSRFAHASNSARGHDETVEMATADEESFFKGAITEHVRKQLRLEGDALDEAIREHYEPSHVMTMHVNAVDPTRPNRAGGVQRYLVSRPVVSPRYLTGRATRGYWAVATETGQVVFLKDTWRLPDEKEGDVMIGLNRAGVRNVPSVLAHGDVYSAPPRVGEKLSPIDAQLTMSDRYDGKAWICRVRGKEIAVSTHVHYRLVLGSVGYPLTRFKGTDELLRTTYDAFLAMRDALAKDARIHRDISDGNIILVREEEGAARKGYLVDWEASSRVDEDGFSLDRTRMGTWKFMSISVVNASPKPQTIRDDMESLFYVVLYLSLLHLPHDIDDPDALRAFIHNFFNHSAFLHGVLRGGDSKLTNAATRAWTNQVKFSSPDLQAWLNMVMDYHSPPYHLREELAGRWVNPDYLDAFWGTFLGERTLPQDDRVDNEVGKPRPIADSAPNSLIPFDRAQRRMEVKEKPTQRPPRYQEPPLPLRRSKRLRARELVQESGSSSVDVGVPQGHPEHNHNATKRRRIG
ncbi:hypothetical protein ONZ51_g8762 [Trametes cubensis]|uniref:Fungal-type protein kinase domain-containing protein n=1 Tax=Trametes cubensis TaxID=1111947 RepID=A0AAD7X7X6_9APHY|nr:hypothetical protein ONZ51_g8762 [Trametes cubensis]